MAKREVVAPQASPQLQHTVLDDAAASPPSIQDSPEHKRKIARAEARKTLVTIGDQIAGETLYTRSFKWDVGNKNFPEDIDAHMRFVTKFYPYTKNAEGEPGKPLYVDEPKNELETKQALAKQKIMKKKGLRMIVVRPHMVNHQTGKIQESSTLDDCLEQLGEI